MSYVTSLGVRYLSPETAAKVKRELTFINVDYVAAQANTIAKDHPLAGDEMRKIASVLRRVSHLLKDDE